MVKASSTPSLKRLPPSYEDVCRKKARKSPTKPEIPHGHDDAVFNQGTTVHHNASTPPQIIMQNPEVVTSTSYTTFNPWNLSSIAERSPPKPWTLASVSRQFRAELRSIVYSRTHINIHLQSSNRNAYRNWIKGLEENVAASICHLRIDDWIEIDRMPENAIAESEWGYGFFRLLRTDSRYCRQTIGKWEIAWLRYIEYDTFSWLKFMEQTVDGMKDRLENSAAMAGLGKQNIRGLVKSHRRCIRKPSLTSRCYGAPGWILRERRSKWFNHKQLTAVD